jgi:hypothetical protein
MSNDTKLLIGLSASATIKALARGVRSSLPFVLHAVLFTACAAPHGASSTAPAAPPKIVLDKHPATSRAGAPTPQAADAKRSFDAEDWSQAAIALHAVSRGATGDDEGNKQLAHYHLGIALYRLGFVQGAYGIFSEIADNPTHLKRDETLLWLGKLATELPDGSYVVERIGKYSDADIRRFDNGEQRPLYWQLSYLLGRHHYLNRRYADAIRQFDKVPPDSKDYYVRSQFFAGIASVQQRRAVPAVEAFRKMADQADGRTEEGARLKNLAFLSLARTYYSAAISRDERGQPLIDGARMAAAVAYWSKVSGESRKIALFEQSWAFFMMSDFRQATESLRAAEGLPSANAAEAAILKGIIAFASRRYADARTAAREVVTQYRPVDRLLRQDFERLAATGGTSFLELARKVVRKEGGSPALLIEAMSDRQLGDQLAEVGRIRDEIRRLESSPPAFRASPLGRELSTAASLAREIAERNANELAKGRYMRMLQELEEHLGDADKLLADVAAAAG